MNCLNDKHTDKVPFLGSIYKYNTELWVKIFPIPHIASLVKRKSRSSESYSQTEHLDDNKPPSVTLNSIADQMNFSAILSALQVPPGTPDESSLGLYEMLDVEEVPIQPREVKPIEPIRKPALIPPPLFMGKIPSAMDAKAGSQISSQVKSNSSSIIVAEPKMRDLHKDLVTMVPTSVRRKGQVLDNPAKKVKGSKEEEYQKFISQFE